MEKKEVMVMNLNQTVEEIQGAPRATGIPSTDASRGYKDIPVVSDTEVLEKATRRSFTAEYKRRIIREADVCKEQRQIGALLRREGLYYSNLATWYHQAERGTLDALSSKKRGPKIQKADQSVRRITEQEKEILKLQSRLKKAELIIETQKKIAEIFQLSLGGNQEENS